MVARRTASFLQILWSMFAVTSTDIYVPFSINIGHMNVTGFGSCRTTRPSYHVQTGE